MASGDPSSSRFSQSSTVVLDHLEENSRREEGDFGEQRRDSETVNDNGGNEDARARLRMVFLPHNVVLCDVWHEEFEASASASSDSRVVLNWRPKERMKTGCVALVMCLNIGVDPPDVIKISPCARMECWIDPFSMAAAKALEKIGKTLQAQYERWKRRVHYKLQLDPTVDEVKKLCNICRINAKSDRVLFHYNGHGVPKPTANGEIWVFNASHTQYIPLPISNLDSWLKTPSIYVFDCSAAGMIVSSFIELQEWNASGLSASSTKDFILLGACEAHECLPQNVDFPADMFTSCLTTPIKMALRWFCSRSLLRDTLDYSLVDKIPGHENDKGTLMGELNWIFTAVTDTIAWNVLPHDLFQRLFRQDLLVASLFRNFLLAERIMRSANCSPISYPMLPATHQHHMWDAWDMAAETSLQSWFREPQAEFKPSSFFSEQLRAFKLWLDHGTHHKKPPEQLPIVLWVLRSRCHQYEALVLLGRFLDMGPWAVNLALSVGIIPYVLKLLETPDSNLRQILVFIWTKVLALDKSFQVDLVKDRGHIYFINFLGSIDAYPEERAMAAFVLTVIVDRHKLGQEACVNSGLIPLSLRHLQLTIPNDVHAEPLLLQWLCLCLGKLWEDFPEAQVIGLLADAPKIFSPLLSESQPEVRASAVFAMGNLLGVGSASSRDGDELDEDCVDDQKLKDEMDIVKTLLTAVLDGSLLVRVEVVVALARFALGHNKHLKLAAAVASGKPQSNYVRRSFPSLPNLLRSSIYGYNNIKHYMQHGDTIHSQIGPSFKVGSDSMVMGHYRSVFSSPVATGIMHGSPLSDDSSQYSDSGTLKSSASSQVYGYSRMKPLDSGLFYQCVLALCSLARDPSPLVGALGKQILAGIGIDHGLTNKLCFSGSSDQLGDPKARLSISNRVGLARSPSWFDMGAGMQRVCSGPHLPKLLDSGLSDLLLGSGEFSSVLKNSLLSQSAIYNWSCRHFSRSLLTTDDDEEILTRRKERENFALDCITKWQHSSTSKLNKQIWESKFYTHTKTALVEPFSPVVIAADETETIRIWNYEEAVILNSFDNHNFSDEGISKLCLVNELYDSLLLIASCDGNIRIWKDYSLKGEQKLVTAFSSIQGHRSGMRHVNAVVDWQHQSGYLYASGEISSLMFWDMDKEQLVKSIPLSSECSISALSASQVHGGQLAAGFLDGSVRLYDIRTPKMVVCTTQLHSMERVVGIGFQPGLDSSKIVSASQAGDIRFLDIRNYSDPYLTIDTQSSSLSAFAIHRHAPIIASGLAKSLIKIFTLEGEQLDTISYNLTFMAKKTGSVSCLSFHPYQALLAAGTTDAGLSNYAN